MKNERISTQLLSKTKTTLSQKKINKLHMNSKGNEVINANSQYPNKTSLYVHLHSSLGLKRGEETDGNKFSNHLSMGHSQILQF